MSETTSEKKLINSSDFVKSFVNGNNDFNNNKTSNVNQDKSFKKASRDFNNNAFDICAKCDQKVYQMEKLGPVNQVVFHKGCFKCVECGQILNLKNYFTNPLDTSDKQIYCSKHCPKVPMGGIDARAMGIRAAMMAPAAKMNAPNSDVIRWFGDVPKIGADALHIKEALMAQSEFQRKNFLDNKHNFPFYLKSKEKLQELQKELEKEQKKDEDKLVESFQKERLNLKLAVDKEINEEYEENLRKIAENYERQNRRKESVSYTKEIDELSKTMTLKRKSKLNEMTIRLQNIAKERTADLVKIQSKQMLSLLKRNQEELKLELSDNPDVLAEALGVLTLPSNIPDAHAPRIRKRDLYADPIVFKDLDEYVFQVAEAEHNTYTDMVAQLTATCISDLERARAIFRWITVKDLNEMTFSDSIKQDTPLGLLRGIKFGTESYHTLFMRLCSYAGLICKEIKGHSKSVGYEPGMKIHSGNFTNTWNVVLIQGDWWPVQTNWGARHLVKNKENTYENQTPSKKEKIRYEYDDHYFLTDPDEFVMEFLAEDEEWQLLENPLSLSQFEALPFVRSVFFQNGLAFGDGCKNAIITTNNNGGAEININLPTEHKENTVFHFHLRFAAKKLRNEQSYNGIDIERYTFHTISDQLALFSVHVPIPGDYFFEIFTNRYHEQNKISELESNFEPFKLKCAIKYLIRCPVISGKLYPLPNCASGEWGPLKAKRYFDIKALTHKIGVINTADRVTIKLQLKKTMRILVKLYFNGVDRRALDEFLNVKIDGNKILTINVEFPNKGQYGLDIYGQFEHLCQKTDSLAHICKYLINVTNVTNPIMLPVSNPNLQRNMSIVSAIIPIQLYEISYDSYDPSNENNFTAENLYNEADDLSCKLDNSINNTLDSAKFQPLPKLPQTSSLSKTSSPSIPGPTSLFKAFDLKTSSHKSAIIEKFDKNGNFATEFSKPVEVKLSAKLISTFLHDFSHLVNMKDTGKKCKISVCLPSYGNYLMKISALNEHGQSQNMVQVYSYELNYFNPKASKNGSIKKK